MTAQTLRNALLAAGITCYPPAQKLGKCLAPYCVVVENQTAPMAGSRGMLGQKLYEVICLVPTAQPDALDPLMDAVRDALKILPALRYTGDADATGVDETFVALARSLIYRLPCRLD